MFVCEKNSFTAWEFCSGFSVSSPDTSVHTHTKVHTHRQMHARTLTNTGAAVWRNRQHIPNGAVLFNDPCEATLLFTGGWCREAWPSYHGVHRAGGTPGKGHLQGRIPTEEMFSRSISPSKGGVAGDDPALMTGSHGIRDVFMARITEKGVSASTFKKNNKKNSHKGSCIVFILA